MSDFNKKDINWIDPSDFFSDDIDTDANSGKDINPFLSSLPTQPKGALDIRPGTRLLNRFNVKALIGRGGCGTVYLAEDTLRYQDLAIKIVEVGPCRPDIAEVLFKREISLQQRISDHRHVIKVYDIHYSPTPGTGVLILSMEYADGGTFRKWLVEHCRDAKTRETKGLDIIKQACAGIQTIHQAGAIHLDVKPENLLFVKGSLKVADFGTVRFLQSIRKKSGHSALPDVHGTPTYMSPEQFDDVFSPPLSGTSDIYSLGVILYELLHHACQPPFSGDFERLRYLHVNAVAQMLTNIGTAKAQIVAKCLEKNPSKRFQKVEELLQAIENGVLHLTTKITPVLSPITNTKLILPPSQEKTQSLWEEVGRCLAAKKLNKTIRLCEQILELNPNHMAASKTLKDTQTKYLRIDGRLTFIAQNLSNIPSITALEETVAIAEECSDHPLLDQILSNAKARRRRRIELRIRGCEAILSRRWQEAIDHYTVGEREPANLHEFSDKIGITRLMKVDFENLDSEIRLAMSEGRSAHVRQLRGYQEGLMETIRRELRGWQDALRTSQQLC